MDVPRSSPLDCYEFGRRLLDANDLDPVYVVVHGANLGDVLPRWLISYWCFYHVGTASWVVDQPDYWMAMTTAAGSKEWPRSSERRHFRGKAATDSVEWLRQRGVEALFRPLLRPTTVTAPALMEIVREWKGFGPWISFKVADMIERIGLRRVRFDVSTAMYDGSPTEAAQLLWTEERGDDPATKTEQCEYAVRRVLENVKAPAPPTSDRDLGPQEAETILCKWKSYRGGHYHVGEDVEAVKKGLLRFDCMTSRKLYQAGIKGGLW